MYRLLLLTIFVLTRHGHAQLHFAPQSWLTGNSGVCATGANALMLNPAGLALLDAPAVLMSGRLLNLKSDVKRVGIAGGLRTGKSSAVYTELSHFGNAIYRKNTLALGYARKLFFNLRLGATIAYNDTAIDKYQNRSGLGFRIGLQHDISQSFSVGCLIRHTVHGLTQEREVQKDQSLHIEGEYRPNDAIDFRLGVRGTSTGAPGIYFGIDYQISPNVGMLAGCGLDPVIWTGGIELIAGPVTFYSGAQMHAILGVSPIVGIQYSK